MPNIRIQKVGGNEVAEPALSHLTDKCDEIRARAFELFERRRCGLDQTVEDWLRAESEILGSPAAEFADNGNGYELRVALPGFGTKDVQIVAAGDEVVVHARSKNNSQSKKDTILWTELRSHEVYRRFHVPGPIEADKTEATLENGMLRIVLPKLAEMKEKSLVVVAA